MHAPDFDYADAKYAAGSKIFERALNLYKSGKVGKIETNPAYYIATVQGTQSYKVSISMKHIEYCDCTCYMGQHGQFCKHIIALSLAVLHASGKMTEPPVTTITELKLIKPIVTGAMQKLKPYTGSSRTWFDYQRKLTTGAEMIADTVSNLPATTENAKYLWSIIQRIDKKLINGVDDSDGIVGDCASMIIEQLASYSNNELELTPVIKQLSSKKTNFCFEDDLRKLL